VLLVEGNELHERLELVESDCEETAVLLEDAVLDPPLSPTRDGEGELGL
jgi:hypothetical protein